MQLGLVAVLAALATPGCGRIGFDLTRAADDGDDDDDDRDGGVDADPLPVELVGWYPMERLEPGPAVQLAIDASGRGHDGRCTNCPTITVGKHGNGFLFDGALQLVQVQSTAALETRTAFTVAAWAKIAAAPATRACVATKGLGAGGFNSWAICIEPSARLLFYSVSAGSPNSLTSTITMPLGAWHHLAIRWNGVDKTIWLDGTEVAAATAPIDFDAQTVRIGGEIDSGSLIAMFPGPIDDVRIYDRALDPQQLGALAAP